MELYLIRHGQSQNNALEDTSARTHDPALTELGQQQAALLAAHLADGANRDPWVDHTTGYSRLEDTPTFGITQLFVSPMRRALQTAKPIAEALGLQPEIWTSIHENGGIYLEQNGLFTGYPGMSSAEIAEEFPGYLIPDSITDEGWYDLRKGHEPLGEAFARAVSVAFELRHRAEQVMAGENPHRRIALVSHGTYIDMLLKALFNMVPARQMYFMHYNTGFTRIDFLETERHRGRMLIRHVNRVAHLPPSLIS